MFLQRTKLLSIHPTFGGNVRHWGELTKDFQRSSIIHDKYNYFIIYLGLSAERQIFKTNNIETVKPCQEFFGFQLL